MVKSITGIASPYCLRAALPVEQPKKFEFIINLKAAKQIGLTIPPNVIVVTGVGDLRSAKEATATIPVVMVVEVVSSPVWRKTPRC